MNFEDEDYVRYYTRDTVSWRALGWEGQTVMALMLHGKFDRSGVFDCDSHEPDAAVSLVTGLPLEVVQAGLPRILKAGTWVAKDGKLVWPKFIHAQSCRRSDRIRKQESRENRRDKFLQKQAELPGLVTDGHNQSQEVTPSLADPSLNLSLDHSSTSSPDIVKEIFDYWQKLMKKPKAKLDSARRRKINARLKDFSPRDLCQAIRGAKNDDFLMGRDPKSNGKQYNDFKTIFRDAAQVERLIALDGQQRGLDGRAFTQDKEEAARIKAESDARIAAANEARVAKLRESASSVPKTSISSLVSGINV
jgi:hypothetical protein